MEPGIFFSHIQPQVSQLSCHVSPWKFLSFLGCQATWLCWNLSSLMGLRKPILLLFICFFLFLVCDCYIPIFYILGRHGIYTHTHSKYTFIYIYALYMNTVYMKIHIYFYIYYIHLYTPSYSIVFVCVLLSYLFYDYFYLLSCVNLV